MVPTMRPSSKNFSSQSETLPCGKKSLKGISEKMLWRDDGSGAYHRAHQIREGLRHSAAAFPRLEPVHVSASGAATNTLRPA